VLNLSKLSIIEVDVENTLNVLRREDQRRHEVCKGPPANPNSDNKRATSNDGTIEYLNYV